ncbi:MAG TPA: hypothetical protein DCE08_06625 [Ruminococcaceae bacterium]|nr:hypothetical protein [Oscillospiraceae bacterium]
MLSSGAALSESAAFRSAGAFLTCRIAEKRRSRRKGHATRAGFFGRKTVPVPSREKQKDFHAAPPIFRRRGMVSERSETNPPAGNAEGVSRRGIVFFRKISGGTARQNVW